MRTGEDGEADGIGILLDCGLGDLLGRLVQPCVDHLHAGVPEGAGDDLGAAVVSVEPGLGDDDANLLLGGGVHRFARERIRCLTVFEHGLSTVSRKGSDEHTVPWMRG